MEDLQPRSAAGDSSGFDRRQFLLRAGAAGAIAWAVPAIVTMEPAGAAQLTSPPPGPPEVEVLPNTATKPPLEPGDPAVEAQSAVEVLPARTELPVTGSNPAELGAAGLAALAGGGALHIWSAKAARAAGGPVGPAVPPPAQAD